MILLLIGCVCLLGQQVAQAAPIDEETCIKEANEKLTAFQVPEEVKQLNEMAISNDLSEVFLLDIVGSSKDNLLKAEKVYKTIAADSKYDKACMDFDESVMSLIRSFSCEKKLLEVSSVSALSNMNILGYGNAVNKINRYRTACIMMKMSA